MKNNKKKFALAIISAALVISLTACGESNDISSGTVNQTVQSVNAAKNHPMSLDAYNQVDRQIVQTVTQTPEGQGTCGENLFWYYKDWTLVIDGTGDMKDFYVGELPEYFDLGH